MEHAAVAPGNPVLWEQTLVGTVDPEDGSVQEEFPSWNLMISNSEGKRSCQKLATEAPVDPVNKSGVDLHTRLELKWQYTFIAPDNVRLGKIFSIRKLLSGTL